MNELKNQIALVTGGSGGIGSAISYKLALGGAKVVVNYNTNKKAADIIKQKIELSNGECLIIQADISKPDEVNKMFDFILEKWGSIHILVNNAGIIKDNLILKMTEEEWLSVINTNLSGVFFCTKIASKIMLKQRYGRIINITSVVALTGNVGQCNYISSKAGIIGFTKSIARELGSKGITVNSIAPGFIETEMTKNLSEEKKKELLSKIPLGRAGKPEEIAELVYFLVTKGDYIIGQTINIDGGMVMY